MVLLESGFGYGLGLMSTRYGLYSYSLYSYGLYSYGLHSYGLCTYGLCSYGLCWRWGQPGAERLLYRAGWASPATTP